jgi:2-polyprenyl-3-methyl-5-hydroxy-6-metoxy-1,4-benzoquinol methylase
MSETDAEKWDRIYRSGRHCNAQAAAVLSQHRYLLPQTGKALDLACGPGANAMLLAQCGLETHAWDISATVLDKLAQCSRENNISIHLQQRDVVQQPPGAESFDVIVVSRFLHRQLIPSLIKALRQQGLIFYQTFTRDSIDDSGPSNPAYRLKENELLLLFAGLHVLLYREEGTVGDITGGFRNEAMLIAQKK